MPFNSDLDTHLVQMLERIGEVSRALRWKQAVETGLSPLQIRILGFLAEHANEAIGVARLAEELMVSKATISDSVKLLAERKLLVRKPDKSDARSHALKLTAEGKRNAAIETPMNRAIAELPTEGKETLLLGLMGVLEALFRKQAVPMQRMCFTCKHYRGDRSTQHHCQLLEKTMKIAELRTNCAEHEPT